MGRGVTYFKPKRSGKSLKNCKKLLRLHVIKERSSFSCLLLLFVVVCCCLRLFAVVCGCSRLFAVDCGCLWLFAVVCGCLRLFAVVCGCLQLLLLCATANHVTPSFTM